MVMCKYSHQIRMTGGRESLQGRVKRNTERSHVRAQESSQQHKLINKDGQ